MSSLVLRGLMGGTGGRRLLAPLCVVGVALGVAVVIAVDLANESARRAIQLSASAMSGGATHRIVSAGGALPEGVYATLRVRHGVRDIAPVVEAVVTTVTEPTRRLRLHGIDPFADGAAVNIGGSWRSPGRPGLSALGAVALSDDLASRLGVREGDTLDVRAGSRRTPLTVAVVIPTESAASRDALADLLVADIATAQETLGTAGVLTRIDVAARLEADMARLKGLLPASATVVPASSRADTLEAMTHAFRVNLTAMSLLALVFGMFLVYSAVSFSVVRRRHLMGTLRVLGVTPGQLRGALLVEAALIGVAGTALGLALGVLVASGLVRLVTRTISDLYFVVTVRSLAFGGLTVAKAVALGLGGTVLAAMPGIRSATATPPVVAMRRSTQERASLRGARVGGAVGAALASGGGLLLLVPSRGLLAGFAALFCLLIGLSLAVPLTVWVAAQLFLPVARRAAGTFGGLAVGGVGDSLSRTVAALAALMAAVAVTVSVDVMIGSMRGTVMGWLSATLRADVYISATRDTPSIPREFIEATEADRNVDYVSTYWREDVYSGSQVVPLVAVRIDGRGREAYSFRERADVELWTRFESGAGVLISEPFGYKRDLAVGGAVSLLTEQGARDFPILGVYYDYGSTEGEATMSRGAFDTHWPGRPVRSLGVYVGEPRTAEAVTASARERGDALAVDIHARTNRALRAAAVEVFDRTFAITGVLRALTGVVAFVGVLGALLSLQIEKGREYAVLRAIGATPRQVFAVVTAQTGFMGLAAGVIALPVGLLLASVMVHVINRRSFGWTIHLATEPAAFARGALIAVVAATLAGLYPAARLAWTTPAAALREE